MASYISRRLAGMAVNLVLVSLFVFMMLRIVPGDAATAILGENAQVDQIAKFRHEKGLDGSWYSQYLRWSTGVIHSDFGKSLRSTSPVTKDFLSRFPITLEIVLMSFTITTIIGIFSGIMAARYQNSPTDMGIRLGATFAISIPSFVLLTLLLVIPARLFRYAPPFGATDIFASPVENLRLFLPPTAILAIGGSAVLMRFTRSGFLEVMRQDYIRTALAKGLNDRDVAMRHALRNALPPILTLAGLQLGALLGGSVILESVMSLPGLGTWFLNAIQFKDYPVVMIVALYSAFVLMSISLAVDLAYGVIDPRIRFSQFAAGR